MKKVLVLALFLAFAGTSFAQNYTFPTKDVNEVDVVISAGTLNVRTAKVKNISVNVRPAKSSNVQRIIQVNNDKKLQVYLNDKEINRNTVIDMVIPNKNADLEINSENAVINISDMQGELQIKATNGNINITNFDGDFDLETVDAKADVSGVFKELDINTTRADVNVTVQKLPSSYDFDVKGGGNVTFFLNTGIKKEKMKVERDEYRGALSIR